MAGPVRATAVILAATFLLAACQPSGPGQPTPTSSPSAPVATPTPTFMCTPEAGGEASPCSEAQHDEMKAKDALYEEAEAVFREYFAENIRISRAGGVEEPTEVILATTTGAARESVMKAFREFARRGSRARGPDPTLSVAREPGASRDGSVVAIRACVDASAWAFYKGDDKVSEGRTAEDRVYFSQIGDGLRMAFIEGRWVESCD